MITGSPLVSPSFIGRQSPPYRRGMINASKPSYSACCSSGADESQVIRAVHEQGLQSLLALHDELKVRPAALHGVHQEHRAVAVAVRRLADDVEEPPPPVR